MNYAIILAGGVGSRFWPLSRQGTPKQFLGIAGQRPMLEESLRRMYRIFPKTNVYLAANIHHRAAARACLARVKGARGNAFFEPEGKNTLAPIAHLARLIGERDPDAVVAAVPSDHVMENPGTFLRQLQKGMRLARAGSIVTLGVTPTRPETGYGYIKVKRAGREFAAVERFIEKPDLKTAEKFIKDKRYFWNSGVFIFRPRVLLEEVAQFQPAAWRLLAQMNTPADIRRCWPRLPAISLDYAVMEHTRRAQLIPAQCGWRDLGSWESIVESLKKDRANNTLIGNSIDLGSANTLVWADKRLVATVGLRDLIVVDAPDAVLICAKDKSQDVKKIVRLLASGRNRRLI